MTAELDPRPSILMAVASTTPWRAPEQKDGSTGALVFAVTTSATTQSQQAAPVHASERELREMRHTRRQMRLDSLNESVPRRPYQLSGRLEVLLSLWGRRPWYRPRRESSFATESEARAWDDIINTSRVVEPASTRAGLVEALARENARQPELGWTIQSVEEAGIGRVVGERAAIRNRIGFSGPTVRGGHAWRLAIQCAESVAKAMWPLCAAKFALVDYLAGELSMGEPHPRMPAVASIIAGRSCGVLDPAQLVTLWRKASAFGVVDSWIELLDDDQRRALAAAISAQLKFVAPSLDWRTDLACAAFAEGADAPPVRSDFPNQLDEAFWAQFALHDSRVALEPISVFNEMARAVVLAGDAMQIGNLLDVLPPGACYFCAIEELRDSRPWHISSLLSHMALIQHGVVAIADLSDSLVVQGEGTMSLRDEWLEVAGHARRLALLCPGLVTVDAAVALAVRDEGRALAYRSNPYLRSPVLALDARMDPWKECLDNEPRAVAAADAILRRLATSSTDPDLVFALRVVALLEQSFPSEAARVARAIADAYARPFDLVRAPGHRDHRFHGIVITQNGAS